LLFFTPRRALRISSTTPFASSSALAAPSFLGVARFALTAVDADVVDGDAAPILSCRSNRPSKRYSGSLVGLVKVGLGVAIVAAHATVLLDRKSVGWKRLERPAIERDVVMVHRAGLSLAPAAEAFAERLLKNNPLPPLWRAAK
jgi:DNA-binding transcriptional LysR family regulator